MQALRDCMEEPIVERGSTKICHTCWRQACSQWLFCSGHGYSQRRLKALKANIRERGCFFATHGNTHQTREHTHIGVAQAVLENYFKEAGCT